MGSCDGDHDPSSSLDPIEVQVKPLSRSAVNDESRGCAGDGSGRRSAADDEGRSCFRSDHRREDGRCIQRGCAVRDPKDRGSSSRRRADRRAAEINCQDGNFDSRDRRTAAGRSGSPRSRRCRSSSKRRKCIT